MTFPDYRPAEVSDVYVAVGGNIDPLNYLGRALLLLEGEFGALTVSPAYRNPAVGFEGEDFVNLVVRFTTSLPVAAVRERLQSIEALCDRPRHAPKWASRTLDLDILLYGELVSAAPGLMLPRPDIMQRPYVLKPMADIAPGLTHPTQYQTMRELWEAFDNTGHDMVEITLLTIPRSGRHPPPESGR